MHKTKTCLDFICFIICESSVRSLGLYFMPLQSLSSLVAPFLSRPALRLER